MHSVSPSRPQPYRVYGPTSPTQRINRLPFPSSESPRPKRKRDIDSRDLAQTESPQKKHHIRDVTTPSSKPEADARDPQDGADVDWSEYFGQWPPEQKMSQTLPNKRPRLESELSYSQSVREGKSSVQWSANHEERMREAGVFVNDYQHVAKITKDDQKMCDELLSKAYPVPEHASFQEHHLRQLLDRVQYRNEARVFRDVTPLLVPSPESLYFDGNKTLADIRESLDTLWTHCDPLGGPQAKPDIVMGISPSALNTQEANKLKFNHTRACPNFFPENMYFPFFICEAKQRDVSIHIAECQAMHSASIAVRAVIRLFEKTPLITEVNERLLVFSVVHNHSTIKMFGHFANVGGDRMTFHRYQLFSQEFGAELSSGKWTKAYQISRAIFEIFFPTHLARIKRALSHIPNPSLASSASHLGPGGDPQASAAESGEFKQPSIPAAELEQHLQNLTMQLAQQREESQVQVGELKKESQEWEALMKQQMKQRQQMEQQMQLMEQQLTQHQELIKLLKEKMAI